ncbi:MAG TPA: hypothetical protein VMB26_11550 [Candidatus Binataceae bacterium]|nr:hypothetical protein [Candidatus Binataceae bacterium]
MRTLPLILVFALTATFLIAAPEVYAAWTPELFRNAKTVEFYTENAKGEGHWSTVWVVVIDDAPYLRLGAQSAMRIDGNAEAPYVKIRVGGETFDRVVVQSAPEMADKVAAAMAKKYWTDMLIRHVPHELVVRLVPSTRSPQQ